MYNDVSFEIEKGELVSYSRPGSGNQLSSHLREGMDTMCEGTVDGIQIRQTQR